jgi:hypothetical protein
MGNITLFELHPDGDIQVGPKSLGGSKSLRESKSDTETAGSETTDESDSGRSIGSLLILVGVLAVLVVMATKLLGEDADEEIAGFEES